MPSKCQEQIFDLCCNNKRKEISCSPTWYNEQRLAYIQTLKQTVQDWEGWNAFFPIIVLH